MEKRIVMLGFDGAGKTTILYKLKTGDIITSIPTIGFNVEAIEYNNIKFTIWAVGGQSQLRTLWRHYFENTNGLIFVVDSHDRERIDEVRKVLHETLAEEELQGIPLLIFANKQDLPYGMDTTELTDKLNLHSLSNRNWHIQATHTLDGTGLNEGLNWLANQFKDN